MNTRGGKLTSSIANNNDYIIKNGIATKWGFGGFSGGVTMNSFGRYSSQILLCFIQTIKILWALVIGITLSSCGGESDSRAPTDPAQIKVYVPDEVRQAKLPDAGTLLAYLTLDNGSRRTMTVGTREATISLTEIPFGEHTFTVEFEFDSDDFGQNIVLSRASQAVDITASSNSISFDSANYDTDFDNDDDGRTNLEELNDNLNPNVANLAENDPLMISFDIPDIIANQSFPSGGQLRVFITVDSDDPQEMTMSDTSASISLLNVTIEEHLFVVEFRFVSDSNQTSTVLASAESLHTVESSVTPPEFLESDFSTDIDDDEDGRNNLDEIVQETDPNDDTSFTSGCISEIPIYVRGAMNSWGIDDEMECVSLRWEAQLTILEESVYKFASEGWSPSYGALNAADPTRLSGTVVSDQVAMNQNLVVPAGSYLFTLDEYTLTYSLQEIDITPDPVVISDQMDVTPGEFGDPINIVVSGIDTPTKVEVVGGRYQIGSAAYTSESGVVSNGDTVRLQPQSPEFYHDSVDVSLTIGASTIDFTVTTGSRPDYDLDDDGLIEINRLKDLDEIRNNLDGSMLYGRSDGCPELGGCTGFELTTDLDFDTNGSGTHDEEDLFYNNNLGWIPIGSVEFPFTADLEGNGHVIRNLFINTTNSAIQEYGLFGGVSGTSIRRLVLTGDSTFSGINVTSDVSVEVGSVAGEASNIILESVFSTVPITVDLPSASGNIGGLIGTTRLFARINQSAYTGSISVSGDSTGRHGGFVGDGRNDTQVNNSFSTASVVSNSSFAGGILGRESTLVPPEMVVLETYWVTDSSGLSMTQGGEEVTLSDLQCYTREQGNAHADCTPDAPDLSPWIGLVDENDNFIWNFGSGLELPGLVMNGILHRDSDGDGVLDADEN